jgi:hypothetical protein
MRRRDRLIHLIRQKIDTQTERERETNRHIIDIWTKRESETDKKDRQTDRQTDGYMDRQMDIWTDRWIYGHKIDTWKGREGRTER